MSLPGFPKRKIVTDKCQHRSSMGGTEVTKHEFPHQALLGYDTSEGIEYKCGGSLISSNFILTGNFYQFFFLIFIKIHNFLAATCTRYLQYEVKYVKLGMNNRLQADDKVFTYGVEEIIVHSEYTARTYNNDIALLKLNGTVKFTEFLYPACLPTSQPENERAIVTGFGKIGRFEPNSDKLMKVIVEKFTQSDCQNILRTIKIDGNSMICYGNKMHQGEACQVS